MGRLRSYLSTEQTAKFLILMEKVYQNHPVNTFKIVQIKTRVEFI